MAGNEKRDQGPGNWFRTKLYLTAPISLRRSDRVEDGSGRPRHYYNVRMKNFGIAVIPIDSRGHTRRGGPAEIPLR